jgi:hypothetical protein
MHPKIYFFQVRRASAFQRFLAALNCLRFAQDGNEVSDEAEHLPS